jgi:hypothetical protein
MQEIARTHPPHIPPALQWRYTLWTLSIALAAFGLCCGCPLAVMQYSEGDDTIVSVPCQENRRVDITAARSWEAGRSIGVRVVEDGATLDQTTMLYDSGKPPGPSAMDFRVVELDSDYVAVFSNRRNLDPEIQWELHYIFQFSTRTPHHSAQTMSDAAIVDRCQSQSANSGSSRVH